MTNALFAPSPIPTTPLASRATAEEPTDRQLLERFIQHQDEEAFAGLVRRHGAMVLSVCQRVLNDTHDAEDAFQATFLVLVRRAQYIGRPELLGNWLYGVAYRTSLKARSQAARRCHHERQAASMPAADPLLELAWRELRTVLDEELQRLPSKLRAPLVLCYLEGLTNEEAARRLGCPPGSMSYRLARGRELLRARLESRCGVPAGAVPLLMARPTLGLLVPAQLVNSTVQAAMGLARGGQLMAESLSPPVGSLMNQTLKALSARRRRGTLAILLAILLAGLASAAIASAALEGLLSFGAPHAQTAPVSGNSGASGGGGGCR